MVQGARGLPGVVFGLVSQNRVRRHTGKLCQNTQAVSDVGKAELCLFQCHLMVQGALRLLVAA